VKNRRGDLQAQWNFSGTLDLFRIILFSGIWNRERLERMRRNFISRVQFLLLCFLVFKFLLFIELSPAGHVHLTSFQEGHSWGNQFLQNVVTRNANPSDETNLTWRKSRQNGVTIQTDHKMRDFEVNGAWRTWLAGSSSAQSRSIIGIGFRPNFFSRSPKASKEILRLIQSTSHAQCTFTVLGQRNLAVLTLIVEFFENDLDSLNLNVPGFGTRT